MKTSLGDQQKQAIFDRLTLANGEMARRFPGDRSLRQPVHTVYGGAHLFKAQTVPRLGELARKAFRTYAPSATDFATAVGMFDPFQKEGLRLDEGERARLAELVYQRVCQKLEREAVEDFRIDFEDGFGVRSDGEEDACAVAAAREVASAMRQKCLPPYFGIRVKALSEATKVRSLRTLDLFITELLDASGGLLPEHFVVTLPKVQSVQHVEAFVAALAELERLALDEGQLKLEIMIESNQAMFDRDGRLAIPAMIKAGLGRIVGVHLGAYDYSASQDIVATFQTMDHPSCNFARQMMKLAVAGTDVHLADGATTLMPIGPYPLDSASAEQRQANLEVVRRAWKLMYGNVSRSLVQGFYQGWDLHPAQLPVRYAACYAFFLTGFQDAATRLSHFIDKAAQASRVGEVFDDEATGQGLLNYFLRAMACGALTEAEVRASGLSDEELKSRSFLAILAGRRV